MSRPTPVSVPSARVANHAETLAIYLRARSMDPDGQTLLEEDGLKLTTGWLRDVCRDLFSMADMLRQTEPQAVEVPLDPRLTR